MQSTSGKTFTALVLATIALATSGCVSMKGADKNMAFTQQSPQGLIVMRVTPDYRIGMKKGDASAGAFANSQFRVFELNAIPEGGYIVAAVSPTQPDQTYAITQVLPAGFTGAAYMPCDGKRAPTFEVKPGKIHYIGDFEYTQDGKQMAVKYSVATDAAVKHLRAAFPQVQGSVEYTVPTFRDVTGLACTVTFTAVVPR